MPLASNDRVVFTADVSALGSDKDVVDVKLNLMITKTTFPPMRRPRQMAKSRGIMSSSIRTLGAQLALRIHPTACPSSAHGMCGISVPPWTSCWTTPLFN